MARDVWETSSGHRESYAGQRSASRAVSVLAFRACSNGWYIVGRPVSYPRKDSDPAADAYKTTMPHTPDKAPGFAPYTGSTSESSVQWYVSLVLFSCFWLSSILFSTALLSGIAFCSEITVRGDTPLLPFCNLYWLFWPAHAGISALSDKVSHLSTNWLLFDES